MGKTAKGEELKLEFLKTPKVAEITGMSVPSVRKEIILGNLKAYTMGGDYFVKPEDLAKWMSEHFKPVKIKEG